MEDLKGIIISPDQHPAYRGEVARQRGNLKKLLFKTWGGLGDQICAEPTLRYALKEFKDCEISLASECPELFQHLKFAEVFNLKKVQPIWENYFVFTSIVPPTDILWQFFSHCLTQCVDFTSLCSLRMQLPVKDREVNLEPQTPNGDSAAWDAMMNSSKHVIIHAGRHWPSKTFPKDWWDQTLSELKHRGLRPVLIGADTDDNRGTVDVDTAECLDLRNKLSISESIWLLKRARVLITNDSSPLHMAVAGKAWIGFIATCKHPDYITHWRNGQWGWQMQNLGKGGMWDLTDYCPNKTEMITVEHVDEEILRSWLPEPKFVAEWAANKFDATR